MKAYTFNQLTNSDLIPLLNIQYFFFVGASFDIRDFHDTILKTGSVPLEILEQRVDEMIASSGVTKMLAQFSLVYQFLYISLY